MKTKVQSSEDEDFVRRGVRALHRAVREELEKKSKLGQFVIVWRNGKTMRVPASDELANCARSRKNG